MPIALAVYTNILHGQSAFFGVAAPVLWKAVPPCPWPKWLTPSTFAIYLIHPFAIFWFQRLASARVDGFAPYCACAVTAILVPIAVKFALLAITSRLTSFLFGGR